MNLEATRVVVLSLWFCDYSEERTSELNGWIVHGYDDWCTNTELTLSAITAECTYVHTTSTETTRQVAEVVSRLKRCDDLTLTFLKIIFLLDIKGGGGAGRGGGGGEGQWGLMTGMITGQFETKWIIDRSVIMAKLPEFTQGIDLNSPCPPHDNTPPSIPPTHTSLLSHSHTPSHHCPFQSKLWIAQKPI